MIPTKDDNTPPKDKGSVAGRIKPFLKDITGDKDFVDGLTPEALPLEQASLKALLLSSMSTCPETADLDVLRAAVQHLYRLQSMATELQDAIMQHFGECLMENPGADLVSISVACSVLDELEPFDIKIGNQPWATLSDALCEKIFEVGVVDSVHVTFPLGTKHNVPTEATEVGALRWLWEKGFTVTPELTVTAADSGNNSETRAEIRIFVPQSFCDEAMRESQED